MRDMVDFVESTLSDIGVPVIFNSLPTGTIPPKQYITYLEYFEGAELEAGDKEVTTEKMVQVNVWSKTNYNQLAKDVRDTLESAGFERIGAFDAPYSDGDSHFNKVLRFRFIDEH